MPRLFTGLEIPAEIGQTLSNLRGGLPGARWIDPENYHVTLRFIGDIDGVAADAKLNQADGMHPTPEGVDIIVKNILPTVEAFLGTISRQRS